MGPRPRVTVLLAVLALTLVGCGEGDGASDGQTGTAQAASACTDQRLASPTDVTLILDFLPTRSTSPHLPGAGRRQLQGQQHQPEDPDPDLDLGHATPADHRLGRHRHRVVAGLPHLPLGGRRSLPQWPLQTTRNWTLRRLGHPAVVAGDIRTERRRPPRRHRGAAGPLPCRPPARSRPRRACTARPRQAGSDVSSVALVTGGHGANLHRLGRASGHPRGQRRRVGRHC